MSFRYSQGGNGETEARNQYPRLSDGETGEKDEPTVSNPGDRSQIEADGTEEQRAGDKQNGGVGNFRYDAVSA